MEIAHKPSGEPFVILHENGKKLLDERQAHLLLISLTHTQEHAAAVAILERNAAHEAIASQ